MIWDFFGDRKKVSARKKKRKRLVLLYVLSSLIKPKLEYVTQLYENNSGVLPGFRALISNSSGFRALISNSSVLRASKPSKHPDNSNVIFV